MLISPVTLHVARLLMSCFSPFSRQMRISFSLVPLVRMGFLPHSELILWQLDMDLVLEVDRQQDWNSLLALVFQSLFTRHFQAFHQSLLE